MSAQRGFGAFVARARAAGELVVQPRMGFGTVDAMRAGLRAVRAANATTAGTITVDSYTRVGDHDAARRALDEGRALNGFPLVAHGPARTRELLDGVHDACFPVQVRHGTSLPAELFDALVSAGLDATEGGPVSYCLPYGRTPLRDAIEAWKRCCEAFAERAEPGVTPHLESFGGCLLGQLCPPALLVAVAVLEGVFFARHGVRSISLSYAQQTHAAQDEEALRALRRLAAEHLPGLDTHVVVYTYMGVFPRSEGGALDVLAASARLAVRSGAERLIVKTPAEAYRIPTVADNVRALEHAAAIARAERAHPQPASAEETGLYEDARALIACVLDLDDDLGTALRSAFERGYLDVPFCLHADNAGRSRSVIAPDGRLEWARVGAMPLAPRGRDAAARAVRADDLLAMLSFVERRFDAPHVAGDGPGRPATSGLPTQGCTR